MIRDVEASIEASPKILPGDHRRKLDELVVRQLLAELGDLFIRCGGRGCGERRRVVQNALLKGAERIALGVEREVA